MSGSWGVLIIALCAVAGYVVVTAFLSKRDGSQKSSEETSKAKDAGRGEAPQELWYQILRVSPSASAEEIQSAFRTEISKYHPDRVASLGFELRALAENRSKMINGAYMEGLRIREGRAGARR